MTKVLTTTDQNEVTVKDAEFCIKTESDFTETVYHNICTGETYTMPTGTYDYMIGIPAALLLVLAVGILVALFGLLVRMFFE